MSIREEEKECRSKRVEGERQGQRRRAEDKDDEKHGEKEKNVEKIEVKNDEEEKGEEEENEDRKCPAEDREIIDVDSPSESDESKDGDEGGTTTHHFDARPVSPSPKRRKTYEGKTDHGSVGGYIEAKDNEQDEGDSGGNDNGDNAHGDVANEVVAKISRITRNGELVISYENKDATIREMHRIYGGEAPKARTGKSGIEFSDCDDYAIVLNAVLRRKKKNSLSWSKLKNSCKAKAIEHKGITSVDEKIKEAFTDRAKTLDPYSNRNQDKYWAEGTRKVLETDFGFLNN